MSKKALLMILDGWGIGDQGKDDVIFNTPTPYWDSLLATYPHSELQASGENVGLSLIHIYFAIPIPVGAVSIRIFLVVTVPIDSELLSVEAPFCVYTIYIRIC